MKISIEWLNEYVQISESPEQLKQDLTMIGLLVESIEMHGSAAVLDIEITSNRPDCLSHIGIAREVAALYGRPLKMPPITETLNISQERIPYKIGIKDAGLCPRYVGLDRASQPVDRRAFGRLETAARPGVRDFARAADSVSRRAHLGRRSDQPATILGPDL